MKELNKHKIKQ
jgi:hypothetical protein